MEWHCGKNKKHLLACPTSFLPSDRSVTKIDRWAKEKLSIISPTSFIIFPPTRRLPKWKVGPREVHAGEGKKNKKKTATRESRTLLLTRDWILVEMVRLNAELQKELQEELQRELQRGKVMDQKMAHVAWKPATDGRWGGPIV